METVGRFITLEGEIPKPGQETTVYHVHTYQRQPPRIKVKLDRGQRGNYGWEVDAEAESIEAVLALVRETDAKLRAEYGSS